MSLGCGGRYSATGWGTGGRVRDSTDSSDDFSSCWVTDSWAKSSSRERDELVDRSELEKEGSLRGGKKRAYYAVWAHFWRFLVSSSNRGNI